jgi:hypothetical protein
MTASMQWEGVQNAVHSASWLCSALNQDEFRKAPEHWVYVDGANRMHNLSRQCDMRTESFNHVRSN